MKKNDSSREVLKALSMLSQLGLAMAACIVIGVVAGNFLDKRLNTSPWLLLIFSVIGAFSAFKVLYDIVIKEWMK